METNAYAEMMDQVIKWLKPYREGFVNFVEEARRFTRQDEHVLGNVILGKLVCPGDCYRENQVDGINS